MKEIIGDLALIGFATANAVIFGGMIFRSWWSSFEPNIYFRWTEFVMSLVFLWIGIDRYIGDIQEFKK